MYLHSLNFLYQFGKEFSGFYSYYYELFKKLQECRIKHSVITNHLANKIDVDNGLLSVYKVGYYRKKVERNPLRWLVTDLISRSNPEKMAKLAIRLYKKEKMDIINAFHSINCGLAALLTKKELKIPSIFHVITGLRHIFNRPPQFRSFPHLKSIIGQANKLDRTITLLYNQLVKRYFRLLPKIFTQSDLIIVPSHSSEKDVLYFGADPEKVKIIPFAVDTDEFSNKNSQDLRDFKLSNAPLILFVGRLAITEKAVDDALKTFKIIQKMFSDAKLIIVGDGPDKTYLSRLSNALGISSSVIFLGSRKHSEIPQLMSAADILLFPFRLDSRGFTLDTFGRVIIEGMSCGKVIVTTDAPPFNEIIVNNEDGLLVQTNDFRALAKVTCKILSDVSQKREIEKNARRKVEELYSFPVIVNKIMSVYKSLIYP